MSALTAAKVNTFGNLFAPGAALVAAPLLARGLGVDGRGEVAAATSPLILAVSAFTFGMPEALTYFSGRHRVYFSRYTRTGYGGLAAAGIALALLLALGAPLLTESHHIRGLMLVSAISLPAALILTGVRGAAGGMGLWWRVSLERILANGIRLTGIVALFVTDNLNTTTATVVIAVTTWLGGVCYVGAFRNMRGSYYPRDSRPLLQLSMFGLRFWPGTLAGALILRLDQFLMVPLSSAYQLGLYVVAVNLAETALVFNNAVRDVLFSVEAREARRDRLTRAARVTTLVTAAMAAMIGGASYFAIPLLFGADFGGALWPTLILLGGIVIGNPGSIAGAGLSGRGRPGLRSVSLMIAAALNVLAIVILVPRFGAVGAAISTAVGNLAAALAAVAFMRVKLGIPMLEFYGVRAADLRWLALALRQPRGERPEGQGPE